MNSEDILMNIVRRVQQLKVRGTPIRALDTRLDAAMKEAEGFFHRKGRHI